MAGTAADSLKNVLSFTWSDPQFSVGLDNSKFTVLVGAHGQNFTSFQSKSFSGVLTGALLGKELNAMAIKFGGTIGTVIALDLKVVASQANNNEPLSSSVVQVNVTPYGDLAIQASVAAVVCEPANATKPGITFTWNTAFNGFSGVKTYTLEYAKGGTSFATPTTVSVSGYTKTFTILELNQMAL